ncbi:hypothetical protein QX952_004422 [Escherichia coli]|nr:hypothetical protein [Escherichia coli]
MTRGNYFVYIKHISANDTSLTSRHLTGLYIFSQIDPASLFQVHNSLPSGNNHTTPAGALTKNHMPNSSKSSSSSSHGYGGHAACINCICCSIVPDKKTPSLANLIFLLFSNLIKTEKNTFFLKG